MKLAKTFGASIYAAAREYTRTNHRACVVFVLEPLQTTECSELRAPVRRIEPSPVFLAQFGRPVVDVLTPGHQLWPVIPVQRKMTQPVSIAIKDLNGQRHDCLAEAFNTTYNILILLYPTTSLTTTTVLMPQPPNSTKSARPWNPGP